MERNEGLGPRRAPRVHRSVAEKRQIVELSLQPGMSVARAAQLAGVEPLNVIHATINGGLRLVASGVGISVVPAPGEQAEIAGVIFRPLLKPPPPIDLIAVWNRNSKAWLLHRFLEILDEVREVSPTEDCALA